MNFPFARAAFLPKNRAGLPPSRSTWRALAVALGLVLLLPLGAGLLRMTARGDAIADRLLFQMRGAQRWDDRLVLITIDDASLAALGWFPWPRDHYGQLLDVLAETGRNTAVFDLLFADPTPQDPRFAEAIGRHGQVVLSRAWDYQGRPLQPSPALTQKAIAIGHIAKLDWTDHDASPDLFSPVNQAASLPVVAVRSYSRKDYARQESASPTRHNGADLAAVTDSVTKLNWPGPVQDIAQYSFIDVLNRRVPPQSFDDKIVLIGLTATGFNPITTPFDRQGQAKASGVHLQAAAIDNLLNHRSLRVPPWQGPLAMIVAIALLSNLLLMRVSTGRQVLISLLTVVGWMGLCWLALIYHYVLPVIAPLVIFGVSHWSVILLDKSKLSAVNQQLRKQVILDDVTQIRNRYFFSTYLAQIWQQSLRSQMPLSLILCDIDCFKAYNDTYGHPVGDRCLYKVAQAIQDYLNRPSDAVARYGGEEFAIILPDTNLAGARYVAAGIQSAIANLALPHQGSSVSARVTISLGIATFDPADFEGQFEGRFEGRFEGHNSVAMHDLIAQADAALYEAKRNGRDRYCVAPLVGSTSD
jgi:diguanylate cyclase (GGDEF)-like protein